MKIIVKNRSNQSMSHMGPYLKSFLPFAQKRLGFNRPPTIFFDSDADNSEKVLGKTGYYDPDASEVVIFIDKRHPKDILRSLSHELVHHSQNCRGDLEPEIAGETGPGYAQTNPHMRQMESEAYEKGNLCMRDWEDSVKVQLSKQVELQETNYLHITGDSHKMATYEQLKEQITKKVVEALKEKMNEGSKKPDNDGDGVPPWADKDDNDPEVQEEGEAFAPNHYCVHHGGVQHEGKIHMAEAVGHNWSEEMQRVTHYDMKLEDGAVLENVAFEDIQITNASLAEGHPGHDCPDKDDEELEERKKRDTPRDNDRREPQKLKMNEDEVDENEEASNLREGNIHYEGLLKAVSDFTLEFLQGWHDEAKVELRQEVQANGFDISKVIMQSLGGGDPHNDKKPKRGLEEESAPYSGLEDYVLQTLSTLGGEQPLIDIAAVAGEAWAADNLSDDDLIDEEDMFYSVQEALESLQVDGRVRLTREDWLPDQDFYALAQHRDSVEKAEERENIEESNDHWYQKQLFEKLSKRWTK